MGPVRPVLAVVGGGDLRGSLRLIDNLMDTVDEIVIAGDICFAFLRLQGRAMADSPVDEFSAHMVKSLMRRANHKSVKMILPTDFVIGNCAVGETPKKKKKKEKPIKVKRLKHRLSCSRVRRG